MIHTLHIASLLLLATVAVAPQAGQPPASLPTVQILPPGAATIDLTVSGQLFDDRDRSIGYGRVGLMNPERTAWQPLTSVNADGSFSFGARVLPGKYIVIAATGAYELAETSISISIVEGARTAVQRLILRAVKAERELTAAAGRWLGCAIANMPATAMLNEKFIASLRGISSPPVPSGAPRMPPPPAAASPSREFFYVTNRRTANPVEFYDDDVDVPLRVTAGTFTVQLSATPPYSPPRRLAQTTDLIKHMGGQNAQPAKILVFVHGFNVSFTAAMVAVARLAGGLAFNGPVVLYSWPGGDGVSRYGAGTDQVDDAARPLRDLLTDLREAFKGSRIAIVAHSLGNRVLIQALEQQPAVYDSLLMVAPDVYVKHFRNWALKAAAWSAQRTLYASARDCALMASGDAHGRNQRAGEAAPDLTVVSDFETVDASTLLPADNLGHSLYLIRAVQQDMQAIIEKSLPPAARGLTPRRNKAGQRFWRFK